MFSNKQPQTDSLFSRYYLVKSQLMSEKSLTFYSIDVISMLMLILAFAGKAHAFSSKQSETHSFTFILILLAATTLPFLKRDRDISDLNREDQQAYFDLLKQLTLIAASDLPANEDKASLTNALANLSSQQKILKHVSLADALSTLNSIESVIVNLDGEHLMTDHCHQTIRTHLC